MAATQDNILNYASQSRGDDKWERAMKDIFYFVEHFVPKRIFDLEMASKQQKAFLKAVENGRQYFAIRAPRKGGKTILVAIAIIWVTLVDQTYRWFIVSGSENQAHWLYDYCKQILWPAGPNGAEMRKFFSQFLVGEPKATITEFKKGGWIMYAAASSKAVNAPTADGEGMDEFVLIPKNIVEEAWPIVAASKKPRRLLLSTATEGKENTDAFIDILDQCEPGGELYLQGWMKFEWERNDSPHLMTNRAKQDAESAKFFLSEDMYQTQYIGGMPKRAGRIFPRTFIREAFVAVDPNNPGHLVDGSPYTPEITQPDGSILRKLQFQGEAGGGVDWGFEHDTVITEGYRGLDQKIHCMKQIIGSGSSPSDWADAIEADSLAYKIDDWYADAAGAFQNQEIRNRGMRVTPRPFQERARGKEWMIGVAYYWLSKRKVIIPDTPEFAKLKKQLLQWSRDQEGKPKKGDDDCNDSFIVWLSKWDPKYYEGGFVAPEPRERFRSIFASEEDDAPEGVSVDEGLPTHDGDWESFDSGSEDNWIPQGWSGREEELRKEPWE